MQKTVLLLVIVFSMAVVAQQNPAHTISRPRTAPLPAAVYNTLHDSCTQLDIVFITGKGGSMSLEGRNVRFFTSFVTTRPVDKTPNAALDGTIMWQINAKAYQMANLYFTGDSSGYVTFERNEKEYVNALSPDGAAFLKTHGK